MFRSLRFQCGEHFGDATQASFLPTVSAAASLQLDGTRSNRSGDQVAGRGQRHLAAASSVATFGGTMVSLIVWMKKIFLGDLSLSC